MLLPIRTNVRTLRTPYANYAIIVANVLIFVATYQLNTTAVTGDLEPLRPWAQQFQLLPERPELWQFVSYAFLHGGYMHIIGNMFFLFIFGNNVNDKLGNIAYVCFYLAGAVFSGVGHAVMHSTSGIPTLGASGAVAAVTGAFLVLYPQTLITVVYWFFFIGTIDVPALYFIGLKMILIDNVIAANTPHVAYDAHLAGYAFGILALVAMLGMRIVQGSSFDLWSMLKMWNRRRQYRDVIAKGYDPFAGQVRAKPVKAKEVKTSAEKDADEKIGKLRDEIFKAVLERRLPDATGLYLELMAVDPEQVLPRQHLLDIANQLASDEKPSEAALAYEQFLANYGSYEYVEEVELMLGLLYSRYLKRPEDAARHLHLAEKKLSDPGQLKMCRDELARLGE